MVVVVAEDRDDRKLEAAAGIRENLGLLRQPVRRQIAGEQHKVGVAGECAEGTCDSLPERLCAVDVADCGDADRRCHSEVDTRREG
jgi:hypothetical protein